MRILPVLLALLIALPALTPPVHAAPAMWRVSNASDNSEIILFGTLHELPKGTVWQVPRVMDRFNAADTLVVEVDLPEDPWVLEALVRRLGVRPGLPPLKARVAPDKRTQLARAIVAAKTPAAALDMMETWLAAINLSDGIAQAAGLDPGSGVDTTLMRAARAAGKPIVALETAEEQLGFFDALTEADQRTLLAATLDDAATAPADTAKLVSGWLAGDMAAIAADYEKELRTTPELLAVLVSRRNARWADWLAGVLKRPGKVFVAVGAGHLAGADSVPALLEARGFKVERIE